MAADREDRRRPHGRRIDDARYAAQHRPGPGLSRQTATRERRPGLGGLEPQCGRLRLSGIAFVASGSTPDEGPYGKEVARAVDFILDNTGDEGFIHVNDDTGHGPMYGHGFATLFLSETYGMTRRRDVREKLTKAVNLIVDTQNSEGGWRYQPQRRDADISVTICQVMALRSARNAGLYVPHSTVDRCVEYVKRSQNADGGFMYMLQGGPSAFLVRRPASLHFTAQASTKVRRSKMD